MKKVRRTWGIYEVLNYGPGWKLKRLIINPKSVSSIQRHFKRAEFWWYVRSKKKEYVPIGMWHQLKNYSDKPLEIIELQVGLKCEEKDIERKS